MLKKIFDFENPVMQALSTSADLIILNLLTLLCCLPVVTAGTAWTALHDGVHKLVMQEEETYTARMFFQSFRANLKRGIILGLIFIGVAVLIYLNYLAAMATMPLLRYVSFALALLLLAIGNYAFALTARFENTLKETLKNAGKLAVGWFPRTLGMVVVEVAIYVFCFQFYAVGVPIMFLFGFSLPAYVCALLYRPIFKQLEEEESDDT